MRKKGLLILELCLISLWQIGCVERNDFVRYEVPKRAVSDVKVHTGVGEVVQVASFTQENLEPGVVQLWEGNGCKQDLLCQISVDPGFRADFKNKGQPCDNDEARSISFLRVRSGAVIRLFDHPDGKRSDDWVEIRTVSRVYDFCLPSFERNRSTGDLRVVYHSHNGLDGKVSRVEIE